MAEGQAKGVLGGFGILANEPDPVGYSGICDKRKDKPEVQVLPGGPGIVQDNSVLAEVQGLLLGHLRAEERILDKWGRKAKKPYLVLLVGNLLKDIAGDIGPLDLGDVALADLFLYDVGETLVGEELPVYYIPVGAFTIEDRIVLVACHCKEKACQYAGQEGPAKILSHLKCAFWILSWKDGKGSGYPPRPRCSHGNASFGDAPSQG